MQIYRATNIETGEIIEGGAKDLAKKLGVVTNAIYNAENLQQKVRFVWFISKGKAEGKTNYNYPQALLEEWDRVTEQFRKLRAKGVRA